jgi:hypothetical protein
MRTPTDRQLQRALLAYLEGRDAFGAAQIAGLSRAEFVQVLIDKGILVLEGPSTLSAELKALADKLGNSRLAQVARHLDEPQD